MATSVNPACPCKIARVLRLVKVLQARGRPMAEASLAKRLRECLARLAPQVERRQSG